MKLFLTSFMVFALAFSAIGCSSTKKSEPEKVGTQRAGSNKQANDDITAAQASMQVYLSQVSTGNSEMAKKVCLPTGDAIRKAGRDYYKGLTFSFEKATTRKIEGYDNFVIQQISLTRNGKTKNTEITAVKKDGKWLVKDFD